MASGGFRVLAGWVILERSHFGGEGVASEVVSFWEVSLQRLVRVKCAVGSLGGAAKVAGRAARAATKSVECMFAVLFGC